MKNLFNIVGFSRRDSFLSYMETNSPNVIIISEFLLKSVEEYISDSYIICLSECKNNIDMENNSVKTIFKYQSASDICENLLNIVAKIDISNKSVLHNSRKAKLVGIFSPIGRSGKTTIAFETARMLSGSNKLLVISLSEYSGFNKRILNHYNYDLSDLVYFYLQSEGNLELKLKSVVKEYSGFEYIPPLHFIQDIKDITINNWHGLINSICKVSDYDIIILDISNNVRDYIELLFACQLILMPSLSDDISKDKLEEFNELLKLYNREDIKNNIIEIPMNYVITEEFNMVGLTEILSKLNITDKLFKEEVLL